MWVRATLARLMQPGSLGDDQHISEELTLQVQERGFESEDPLYKTAWSLAERLPHNSCLWP